MVLFFHSKVTFNQNYGRRKETVISETPIAWVFKALVSCHCSTLCKSLNLGLESGTNTNTPAAVCFLALLAFPRDLQKVSFSFLMGNRHNFETSWFSAEWLSVPVHSGAA